MPFRLQQLSSNKMRNKYTTAIDLNVGTWSKVSHDNNMKFASFYYSEYFSVNHNFVIPNLIHFNGGKFYIIFHENYLVNSKKFRESKKNIFKKNVGLYHENKPMRKLWIYIIFISILKNNKLRERMAFLIC